MLDLIVRDAVLPDGRRLDVGVREGRIAELGARLPYEGRREFDARGLLVSPPFVDSHLHLDATLSAGRPRYNESGTLLEGIAIWGELKPHLRVEEIRDRALELCRWAIARGNLAIRSHVDVCDDRLTAVEALLDVRRTMAPYLDLQLVAFPQDGFLRSPGARVNLLRALDLGVDVVGGIPHFERTAADGAASIRELCEIAQRRGLLVDMHCDETDDPLSRHVETLAAETVRLGMQGRVTGSHLTSMHSMDDAYVAKLLPLLREAELHAVANPLVNITLQGRFDTYPKRRGMTRVRELLAAGVNVAFGHDCVMDPWYALGSHDMLEVAQMGLHVGHLTGRDEMRAAFAAVTVNGARALGLRDYGIEIGKRADLVVLQAADPIEALRLRAQRLLVVRAGEVVAEAPPVVSQLTLGAERLRVDFGATPRADASPLLERT
ncbi:MAG TPA: amidohydrolase family protein [Candidatus Limnocylindria bacterium]|jgi:cytosine deaminase|nr:amidohydrolase family protein [Candidatus Limnocylindria bacterium]